MKRTKIAGAAAVLTCLLVAGCNMPPMYPGDPAGVPLQTSDQAWQSGFTDAMNGLPSAKGSSGKNYEPYKTGYAAGTKYKDDIKLNPLWAQPQNPYAPKTLPAGYQTPSASGGG